MNIEPSVIFAALANETRLRCLHLVARNDEVCVCEVVEALQINQPAASKALNGLKTAQLVTDRRDANWNYYRLNTKLPAAARIIIDTTVEKLCDDRIYKEDQRRFKRLDLRG